MADFAKVKKGGSARWVIKGVRQNESFTLPRGFRIRYLAAETMETIPSGTNTISIGTSAGTVPVQTLTTNGTAVGGSGTTVTIDGIAVTVEQLDTASEVMDKIMAAYANGDFTHAATTSTESWTMVRTSDTVITMTGSFPKVQSGVVINVGSITGFTLTSAQVVAGTLSAVAVTATTISNYAVDTPSQSSLVGLTLESGYGINPPSHSPNTIVTLSTRTGTITGTISVNGVAYPFTETAASVTGGATGIKNAINASSRTSGIEAMLGSAGVVIISNKRSPYGSPAKSVPAVNIGSITGCSKAKSSVAEDITYYVNFAGPYAEELEGNVNLYALLEKLD
jgi:hypothetical protein